MTAALSQMRSAHAPAGDHGAAGVSYIAIARVETGDRRGDVHEQGPTPGVRPMTPEAFAATLNLPEPPPGLSLALQALWWDARGDWERAHACAQEDEGRDGSWVHALLHRREGDLANAGYWYRRAGQPVARGPLEAEHAAILSALLAARQG